MTYRPHSRAFDDLHGHAALAADEAAYVTRRQSLTVTRSAAYGNTLRLSLGLRPVPFLPYPLAYRRPA